jgi:Rrf2 family iron-sulfur cluster assembly transcriptional regulator
MVLSKGCVYAIQAAIYIASADSSAGVSPRATDRHPVTPSEDASQNGSTYRPGLHPGSVEETWKRHRPSVSVGEISTALNISFHFLTKILQQLTSANLTHSHRGPNGGIALARSASDISLHDIIVAVDGPGLFLDCLLRPGYCGERVGNDSGMCTAHVVWEPIRKKFMESAKKTTVAALAEAAMTASSATTGLSPMNISSTAVAQLYQELDVLVDSPTALDSSTMTDRPIIAVREEVAQ